MRPSFYSEIHLRQTSFDEARRAYVEWIVGAKRFDKTREGRAAVGVNPNWSMRELHEGTSLFGTSDARVDTRLDGQRFLIRFVHRDLQTPTVLWHSVVKLRGDKVGVHVAHGVARSAPPGTWLDPKTGSPSALRRLLHWNGPDVTPEDIGDASVINVDAAGADETVEWLLLKGDRVSPIVLLVPQVEDTRFLIDPKMLSMRLAGLARVAACKDDAASKGITLALQQRGFSRQFATMDGAARLFFGGLGPADSPYKHRLWTGGRIESIEGDRLERLAAEVAESVVLHAVPQGFFRAIEDFDLDVSRVRVQRIIEAVRDQVDETRIENLRSDRDVLQKELEQATENVLKLRERVTEVETSHFDDLAKLEAAEQALDEQRDALRREKVKSQALSSAWDDSKPAYSLDAAGVEALRAISADDAHPTPEQCLRALALLYDDRVVVLPSAIKSSQQAADFLHGDKLWRLLTSLATTYRDRLITQRGGDGIAKSVFGSSFAAKESETTMSNARARQVRTFTYEDVDYVMWRHLKHGTADTTVESIRVHFEWLADREQVIIGHCGEHLYLPRF